MAMGKLGLGIRVLILVSLFAPAPRAHAGFNWRSCAVIAALLAGGAGGAYYFTPRSGPPIPLALSPSKVVEELLENRESRADVLERVDALSAILDQQAQLPLALRDKSGKVPQPPLFAGDFVRMGVAATFKSGLVEKKPELNGADWLKAEGIAIPIERIVLEPVSGDSERVLLKVVFPIGEMEATEPVSKEGLLSGTPVEIKLGPFNPKDEEGEGIVEALIRVRYDDRTKRLIITEGMATLRILAPRYGVDLSDKAPLDGISSEPLPLP